MNLKKHAFTLAEALITMVIIGVVAALTIPVIMANVFEKSYTTHAKNMVATIEQLAADELVNHKTRFLSSTDFAAVNRLLSDNHFEIANNCANNCNVQGGYFMINDRAGIENGFFNGQTLTLKNGTKITYAVNDEDEDNYGTFFIDVNGNDKPNTAGRDVFGFTINIRGHINAQADATVNGCRGGDPIQCTSVLMNNAWETPNNM